jgi:hypothetical protein
MAVKAYIGTILVVEKETHGGLELPPNVSVGPRQGVVQSVGDDVPHLEPGALVFYCDHDHPKIGDATVIGAGCVMAYEELEF